MASHKLEYRVLGLDCTEEVDLLKRELVAIAGEESLSFDVLNSKLTVEVATNGLKSDAVMKAIARTGLKAVPWREPTNERQDLLWGYSPRALLTLASGLAGLVGFALEYIFASHPSITSEIATHGFYALAILAGMGIVLPKAWRSLVSMRPDMNLLMTTAVVGAAWIGEWSEGATVAFLFSVSLLLESWSIGRARHAIAKLMDLSPPIAHLLRAGGVVEDVAPATLPIGSMVAVRPGERIPLDGSVRTGFSSVNQAAITGESARVEKQPGDDVFAGTINGDGLLEIESTKLADSTMLAQIIKMVGDAQSKRAPSEMWVEKFASYYTPLVMVGALLMLAVPPLFFGGGWADWFYRSLVLLVIACPCALVISTPVSIVAAMASAARHGVLIKGGRFVELPATLRAIAFDKTGTLTRGEPSVIEWVPMNGHSEEELLTRAGALEQHSTHPLANAILAEATRLGLTLPIAEKYEIIPGKGAMGTIGGKAYWVGSHRFLEERGQETPEVHAQLETLQAAGRSIVVVGNDHHVCGFIALADSIRPETREAIAELHRIGIEQVVMLTGDNRGTAESIGQEAGVDQIIAELLPQDKVAAIEELMAIYQKVAMIGDGINDAPSLARASVGIAMGAMGSDAAIETADIALMSDELSKIPWLILHSRRTLQIIRQNIGFSLAVKALFVVLTLSGLSTLWGAIAADTGTSLLVIANGLRLLSDGSE